MREQIGYLGDEDANLTHPVRNIVGFAAGGATDTTARLIGKCLSERLGVPPETVVIVPASSAAAPTIEETDVAAAQAPRPPSRQSRASCDRSTISVSLCSKFRPDSRGTGRSDCD
jgi:hypothetical protein